MSRLSFVLFSHGFYYLVREQKLPREFGPKGYDTSSWLNTSRRLPWVSQGLPSLLVFRKALAWFTALAPKSYSWARFLSQFLHEGRVMLLPGAWNPLNILFCAFSIRIKWCLGWGDCPGLSLSHVFSVIVFPNIDCGFHAFWKFSSCRKSFSKSSCKCFSVL